MGLIKHLSLCFWLLLPALGWGQHLALFVPDAAIPLPVQTVDDSVQHWAQLGGGSFDLRKFRAFEGHGAYRYHFQRDTGFLKGFSVGGN